MHVVLEESGLGSACRMVKDYVGRLNFAGLAIYILIALGLSTQGIFAVSMAQAQDRPARLNTAPRAVVPERPEPPTRPLRSSSVRDSLLEEVRRHSRLVAQLRDSMSLGEVGADLPFAQREDFEESIDEISDVISDISKELSRFELEIEDNRFSFVDETGAGITINIPDNLGEELGAGIDQLSRIILEQFPDTLSFDEETEGIDWRQFIPQRPPPPRQVARGNLIKFWDDVHVTSQDDLRGSVVVAFGNSEISGRVDGNVIVLFGDLLLDETSEVTGRVVSILGRLDQDSEAQVGDLLVINPWQGPGRATGWLAEGGLSFLMIQAGFLLSVFLILIIFGVSPKQRLDAVLAALVSSPANSFGAGLVAALAGHLVALILIAVLILTVIGIPLALIVGLALLFLYLLAIGIVATTVGNRLCKIINCGNGPGWIQLVCGLFVINLLVLLGSISLLLHAQTTVTVILMVVGHLIVICAYLAGLGAITQTRLGSRH